MVDVVGRRNVREGADVELDVLDVAARLGAAEGFAVEGGPVRDAAVQVAQVDKIKVVGRVGPGELGVVDLEAEVGRDPGGLDWADVEADDRGRGVLVGEVAGEGQGGSLDNRGGGESYIAHIPVPVPTSRTCCGGCQWAVVRVVRADKSTDLGIVANWRQRQLVVEEQGHEVVTGKRTVSCCTCATGDDAWDAHVMSRPSACSSSMGALHFGTWRQCRSRRMRIRARWPSQRNLPVFRRLRVLVRATVDLAIVEQARRQRCRRLGSPAEESRWWSANGRRGSWRLRETHSSPAAESVPSLRSGSCTRQSESALLEGGGRAYDGDVVRVKEFVVVAGAEGGGRRGRRPGRGTGHGGRLAVPGDDRPLISSSMRRSGLVEKDAPHPAATRRTRGAVRPSFVLSTGLGSRPLQLAARPRGTARTLEHRPTVSSRPASPLDGGGTGQWTLGQCGRRAGQWDANPGNLRRACRLGSAGHVFGSSGGEGRIFFSDLENPPSHPRFHHRDPGDTRSTRYRPPRIPYAAKRSPFPPNIWGAPASCRRVTVSNWQWSTLFSSGLRGPFLPGGPRNPPLPTPCSVPSSLPSTSPPSRFTATHCTERTRPR